MKKNMYLILISAATWLTTAICQNDYEGNGPPYGDNTGGGQQGGSPPYGGGRQYGGGGNQYGGGGQQYGGGFDRGGQQQYGGGGAHNFGGGGQQHPPPQQPPPPPPGNEEMGTGYGGYQYQPPPGPPPPPPQRFRRPVPSFRKPFGMGRQYYQQHDGICSFQLVETIPEGMSYEEGGPQYLDTSTVWFDMITNAKHRIDIASFYWTLTNVEDKAAIASNEFKGLEKGKELYEQIAKASKERNVEVNIVQNSPNQNHNCEDTNKMFLDKVANVRSLFLPKFIGSGVLHSKFIIVDDSTFYLGSANMDWRALSDVKELGVIVRNCTPLAHDLQRIFQVYWGLAAPNAVLPYNWPQETNALYNVYSPLKFTTPEGECGFSFIGSSPPRLATPGRTNDLQSIRHVLHAAKRFVYISVMSYRPFRMYIKPQRYWGALDNAIRAAAIEKRLEVRIMIAKWRQFRDTQPQFLQSLLALTNVYRNVKFLAKEFVVPADEVQKKIPYARVNHNKFMVTDNGAYIGTSNWIGNYFIDTAGVGLVIEGTTKIRSDLEALFLRDWESQFTIPISLTANYTTPGNDFNATSIEYLEEE